MVAPNGDLITAPGSSAGACCAACNTLTGCVAYTYKGGLCYFKAAIEFLTVANVTGATSGVVVNIPFGMPTGPSSPPSAEGGAPAPDASSPLAPGPDAAAAPAPAA